jgi:hypothetical protein
MAAPYKYDITVKSAMMWANSELEHVGRIAAVKDRHIQRSYAMSTLNGMAHLKDALYELSSKPEYKMHRSDILKTHGSVIRVMKHLMKDYNLDLESIRAFNTDHVLSDLSYLGKSKRSTRRKN